MNPAYLNATVGGILIGTSSAGFLLLSGRIAGVSGLVGGLVRGGLLRGNSDRWAENGLFVIGLLLGPVLYRLTTGAWPAVRIEVSYPVLIVAGLLVGFGTRLGSGCTSGHGVSGLARLSRRSFVAVGTFLLAGMATVYLTRMVGS